MIPALVLTAGLATRLRPLSYVRAKGALPVAGEPIVRRILRWLAAQGVADAVLNLHHLPHTLTAVVGDGSDLGMRVRYSWETPVLGSAGGPRRALPLIDNSTFVIVNGDTMTDARLRDLIDHHRTSEGLVTLAVVPNSEPEKYGGVAVDEDGWVTGFVRRGSSAPSYHFIGVQVAQADAFAAVPANVPYESVGTLYPALIAANRRAVRAFRTTAEFMDVGTPADYLNTALLIAEREGHGSNTGACAQVDPHARVERSILWDDVVVEADARLRECVVTDGVRVPADTSWHGVTLRVPAGELAPGEKRIGDLAVCAL
jgi:NDP-sugar pyrophosphorylase family protein